MSDAPTSERAKVGRKRDHTRDPELLDAALQVLADVGYSRMTMDMVATRAKAGKATIYRRWSSKPQLVLDAVRHLDADRPDEVAPPDTGSLRGDFLALLLPDDGDATETRLRVMAGLTSMLSDDPDIADSVINVIVQPWVDLNRAILERALARGLISERSDIETLAWVMPSMAVFRACIQRQPIPNDYMVGLLDGVLLPALH